MAHRHEVTALYVIDHGWRPASDFDLAAYNREFHRILGACKINSENLTNTMIFLAYKASDQGQRYVTNLMMIWIQVAGRKATCRAKSTMSPRKARNQAR